MVIPLEFTFQHGVEHFDNADQATAKDDQRGYEQDQANFGIGKSSVLHDETTCMVLP